MLLPSCVQIAAIASVLHIDLEKERRYIPEAYSSQDTRVGESIEYVTLDYGKSKINFESNFKEYQKLPDDKMKGYEWSHIISDYKNNKHKKDITCKILYITRYDKIEKDWNIRKINISPTRTNCAIFSLPAKRIKNNKYLKKTIGTVINKYNSKYKVTKGDWTDYQKFLSDDLKAYRWLKEVSVKIDEKKSIKVNCSLTFVTRRNESKNVMEVTGIRVSPNLKECNDLI